MKTKERRLLRFLTSSDRYDPDKIEYDLLELRSKLVFYTAWNIANRDERIVVDKKDKNRLQEYCIV